MPVWVDLSEHEVSLNVYNSPDGKRLILRTLAPQSQIPPEITELGFEQRAGAYVRRDLQFSLPQLRKYFPKAVSREFAMSEIFFRPEQQQATDFGTPPINTVEESAVPEEWPAADTASTNAARAPWHVTRSSFIEESSFLIDGDGHGQVIFDNIGYRTKERSPKRAKDEVHTKLVKDALYGRNSSPFQPSLPTFEVLLDYPNLVYQLNQRAEKNVSRLLAQLGVAAKLLAGEDGYLKIENPPYIGLVIERQPDSGGDRLYLTHYLRMNGDSVLDAEMVFEIRKNGTLRLAETATQNPIRGGELRGRDVSFANMFSKNLLDQGFGAGKVLWPQEEQHADTEPTETSAAEIGPIFEVGSVKFEAVKTFDTRRTDQFFWRAKVVETDAFISTAADSVPKLKAKLEDDLKFGLKGDIARWRKGFDLVDLASVAAVVEPPQPATVAFAVGQRVRFARGPYEGSEGTVESITLNGRIAVRGVRGTGFGVTADEAIQWGLQVLENAQDIDPTALTPAPMASPADLYAADLKDDSLVDTTAKVKVYGASDSAEIAASLKEVISIARANFFTEKGAREYADSASRGELSTSQRELGTPELVAAADRLHEACMANIALANSLTEALNDEIATETAQVAAGDPAFRVHPLPESLALVARNQTLEVRGTDPDRGHVVTVTRLPSGQYKAHHGSAESIPTSLLTAVRWASKRLDELLAADRHAQESAERARQEMDDQCRQIKCYIDGFRQFISLGQSLDRDALMEAIEPFTSVGVESTASHTMNFPRFLNSGAVRSFALPDSVTLELVGEDAIRLSVAGYTCEIQGSEPAPEFDEQRPWLRTKYERDAPMSFVGGAIQCFGLAQGKPSVGSQEGVLPGQRSPGGVASPTVCDIAARGYARPPRRPHAGHAPLLRGRNHGQGGRLPPGMDRSRPRAE